VFSNGCGIPSVANVFRNQKLLYEFFVSAAPWLLPGGLGQIHVALRTSTHYKQWDIEELARKAGLVLKKTVRAVWYVCVSLCVCGVCVRWNVCVVFLKRWYQ
jgi:hypothetical protein